MTVWLLDTGPLAGFFDRSDHYHAWAPEQWARAQVPMLYRRFERQAIPLVAPEEPSKVHPRP
jgi:hypothetical protein